MYISTNLNFQCINHGYSKIICLLFLLLFRAEKGLKILMKEWWSGHFLSLSAWSLLDWHKFVCWNHFSVKRSHLKCTDIINRRCDFSLLFHFGYFVSLKRRNKPLSKPSLQKIDWSDISKHTSFQFKWCRNTPWLFSRDSTVIL